MIRKKKVGLISLLSVLLFVYVLNMHYAAFLKTYFVDVESIVYYMIGAYIGIHGFNWFSNSSRQKTLIGIVVVVGCVLVRSLFDITIDDLLLRTLLLSAFGIGLFFALDMISFVGRIPLFMEHSFWVYAMHLNLSAVITKLFFLIMPKTPPFAWMNFALTIVITLFLIEMCNRIVAKFCPRLYVILSGTR